MSDFGAPATPNYTAPNGITTIGDLMSLKAQKQKLQSGALQTEGQKSQNQSLASTAENDTALMGERQRISQMMQSRQDDQGNSIVGPNGGPDLSKVLPALDRIAPRSGQAFGQNLIKSQTDKVGLQLASQGLDANGRSMLMAPLQAAANDPLANSKDINSGIDNLVEQHPEMRPAAQYLKSLTSHIDNVQEPRAKAQAIQMIAAQMQPGQQVQTQATPGQMDTSGQIQPGLTAPAVGGGGFTPSGPPVNKTIAPAALPVKDANERSFILNPATNKVKPIGTGYGKGNGPTAPNAPQFVQPTADAATVQKNIASARDAGDQAPLNQHINDQLLRLSNDTATGYGTQKWHEAVGALSGGKFGSDYQTIGAYLDRQAAMASKSMGLPDTNAGLAASQSLSGHTGYARDALQTKVKLTDTLNTAAQQYRQGLDRVVGVGPNQDNSKYEAYRSAWAKNFDPQVFAAENAIRRGDKAELEKIQKQEGPQGMAELARKTQALRALSNGQVPQ